MMNAVGSSQAVVRSELRWVQKSGLVTASAFVKMEDRMIKGIFFLALVVFVVEICSRGRAQAESSLPQIVPAGCVAVVPVDWGEYVGSSSFGVAFKDTSGTLRFITHFSCGLENPPHLALVVNRK